MRPVAIEREPATGIAEFAHIPRPITLVQCRHGIRCEPFGFESQFPRRRLHAMLQQQWNILAPLPQRRHVDMHHVQTVI